jgi:signal transduction histidine kinase
MFGRLHHRIYLSLLLVALLSGAGTAFVGHVLADRRFESPYAARLLAEAEHIASVMQHGETTRPDLDELARGLHLQAAVLAIDGRPLSTTFDHPPLIPTLRLPHPGDRPRWLGTTRGPALVMALDDGRVLAVWPRESHRAMVGMLVLFFVLLAVTSIPVARRLTRRLAVLEQGFADLGSGRLSTRVDVQGRDEIAQLAARFNASAERIERLVEAQRTTLRGASHELRSPLARIRMALELMRDSGGPEIERRAAGVIEDIAELDALVEDLLLASRIEADQDLAAFEAVDLGALATEEAQRAKAHLEITPTRVEGDPRLLRRLVRNLVDNAVRHGGGAEITVGVAPLAGAPGGARLWVADRGPGVPTEDRERIFAPFYRGARAPADASGVGLGLALVRQIAERHGGTATCRQREGGGACFEVILPPRSATRH